MFVLAYNYFASIKILQEINNTNMQEPGVQKYIILTLVNKYTVEPRLLLFIRLSFIRILRTIQATNLIRVFSENVSKHRKIIKKPKYELLTLCKQVFTKRPTGQPVIGPLLCKNIIIISVRQVNKLVGDTYAQEHAISLYRHRNFANSALSFSTAKARLET